MGDVAVYTVPKWMDVVYDWTVTGAPSSVPTATGSASYRVPKAGTIDVTYEAFLLGLKEHDAPNCSGEGHLPVILPKLQFANHASLREQHPDLRHQRHRTRLERDGPASGTITGGVFDVHFPQPERTP